MSEEQVGTAPAVTPSAPEPAPSGAGPTVQPEVPAKVETTESKPAQPSVNWDDAQNPYRQRFDGIQGSFKTLKTQHDQLATQLRQYEQDRQTWEADRQRLAAEAEQRKLDELLSQDDGPVAQEVKKARDQQKLRTALQQELEPQLRQRATQEAYQTAYGQYTTGLKKALGLVGVTDEEVQRLAGEKPSFDAFVEAVVGHAVAKKMGSVEELANKRVAEALTAQKAQLLAEQRGKEPSPDTGSGAPVDDDNVFMAAYAAGKSSDHKRARQILTRL